MKRIDGSAFSCPTTALSSSTTLSRLVSSERRWNWCVSPNCSFTPASCAVPGSLSFFFLTSRMFLYRLLSDRCRSKAEAPGVRRSLLWEFNFGVQYAWTLLNFSLVTMYSVSCPLITPFGTVETWYFCLSFNSQWQCQCDCNGLQGWSTCCRSTSWIDTTSSSPTLRRGSTRTSTRRPSTLWWSPCSSCSCRFSSFPYCDTDWKASPSSPCADSAPRYSSSSPRPRSAGSAAWHPSRTG